MDWDVYMGEIHDYMDRAVFHDFWCQVGITALLIHDREYAHGMHLGNCIAKGCELP